MRAIITGAASGIGRAVAEQLNAESLQQSGEPAKLVLADWSSAALEEASSALRDAGAQVVPILADLGDPAKSGEIVEAARLNFGGLDGLVSNAGILHRVDLLDMTLEQYDQSFAINTRPTFLLGKAAYPLLKESQGAIVATTSIAAHEPTPSLGAYSPSKAALLMLVRQMACAWGPDGIRANTVSPGATRTGIGRPDGKPRPASEMKGKNPLGKVAEPEEQAAAIVFLLGPKASYITGADLVVDGGLRTQLMTLRDRQP